MQPREQNGACSVDGGFPQSGHSLALGFFGMGPMDGELGVRAQGDGAADLFGQRRDPLGPLLQYRDNGGVGDEAFGAAVLKRNAAEEGSRFERRTVLREFKQGGMSSRPNDLEEAEAVEAGPFEWPRQDLVDRRVDLGPG